MMQNQTFSTSRYISSSKIESTIRQLFDDYNIQIQNEGIDEINIFCPFHKNYNSAAFYINVKTGLWQCFNPSCGEKGNFKKLYKHITGKPYTKDIKLDPISLQNEIDRGFHEEKEDDVLNILDIEIDYSSDESMKKISTFLERGLNYETLKHFEVGFSDAKNRIVIPVRDAKYKLVGYIGRAVEDSQDPRYLYNKGFKRANVLFNIQNAKQHSSCIVVEGSVDAMFIHQAGFPNVVATLGAKVSSYQITLLRKYFDSIIIFSDNDDAGDEMRGDILSACSGKELYIVTLPQDRKDAGEMTQEEIVITLQNKQIYI